MAEIKDFKWYVIQTRAGVEDEVVEFCYERLDRRGINRIFVPKIELKKKYHGVWQLVKKPMYPGYIFMEADEEEAKAERQEDFQKVFGTSTGHTFTDLICLDLKAVPRLTKMLGTGSTVVPLEESEVKRIKSFIGEGDVAEMSIGAIEGDKVRISEGALKGQEALIKKIDRHKRTAKVETTFIGEKRLIEVGLEIISKSDQP